MYKEKSIHIGSNSHTKKPSQRAEAISMLRKIGITHSVRKSGEYESHVLQAIKDIEELAKPNCTESKHEHTASFPTLEGLVSYCTYFLAKDYELRDAGWDGRTGNALFRTPPEPGQVQTLNRSVNLIQLANFCGGTYNGWRMLEPCEAADLSPRAVVQGVQWHIYENITNRTYSKRVWDFVATPQKGYEYQGGEDRKYDSHCYSILKPEAVSDLMKKLRNGEGGIASIRLKHFSDSDIQAVKEILAGHFFIDGDCWDANNFRFTKTACTCWDFGNKEVALEVAKYAISIGEDFYSFLNHDDEALDELRLAVERTLRSEKLEAELSRKDGIKVSRKIKI